MAKKIALISIFVAAFFLGFSNNVLANCSFPGYICDIACPGSATDDSWAAASDIRCCAGTSCSPVDDPSVVAAAKTAYYSYYRGAGGLGSSFGTGSSASGTVSLTPPISRGGKGLGLEDIINNVINFIFWLAIVICPIFIVWGGFEIATANGEETKITSGKSKITYAIIGLVIIAVSKVMVAAVKSILGAV